MKLWKVKISMKYGVYTWLIVVAATREEAWEMAAATYDPQADPDEPMAGRNATELPLDKPAILLKYAGE